MVTSSGATDFMMNSRRPKGGVISPTSSAISISTPNQIGSTPPMPISGMKKGRVMSMMLIWSISMPSSSATSSIMRISVPISMSRAVTRPTSSRVAPEKDRIWEKVIDPLMMMKIIAVVAAVPASARRMDVQVRDR